MAGGGKESPRQQMINLMYLVLTAMLALQVSSSIINKFLELNEALIHTQSDARLTNDCTMAAFAREVKQEGNKKEGLEAMEKAQKVLAEGKKTIQYLEDLKEKIKKEVAGGLDPKTGQLVNPAEENKLQVMMLGPGETKSGVGYTLKSTLEKYTESVAGTSGINKKDLPQLAEGNANNPLYKGDRIQSGKDFVQANFAQTPAAAALAVLTHRQSEILRTEGIILKKLGAEITGKVIKFDKIEATYSAESNVVANGDKFKAKMFIFASASALSSSTRMTVNGSSISVKDGVGEVSIPASGGSEAGSEQSWKGTITFPNKGKDTTFTFTGKYKVVKPVMSISSASVSALYEGCGNELEVTVPALGTSYNPSFTASGAACLPGSKKGVVIVVPSPGVKEVTLNVSSGGMAIGSQKIAVRAVPSASAVATGSTAPGGGEYTDLSAMCPSSLTVKIVPDESFATFLPKEASYRVESFQLIHGRGSSKLQTVNASGGSANTSSMKGKAREGDRLVVTAIVVKRSNFRGELLNAKISTKYIQVNLKQ